MDKHLKKFDLENLREISDLAIGTFGKITLCYDRELQQHVAVKIFCAYGELLKFQKLYASFQKEANIHAQFTHENIIRVLGALLRDDRSFAIILEYAPCGNLERLLHNEKDVPLPWKLRARLFTELAAALNYLHNFDLSRRYIHGDLKPQNVLLGDRMQVKLADFGSASIAKLAEASSLSVTADSNTQHTPFYTAPEYLANITKGRHSSMDVYSYGMIGYEILTRNVVFSGASVPHEVIKHLIREGQKPDERPLNEVAYSLMENSIESVIFAHLKKIVERCWQTKREDRPKIFEVKQSLDELAKDKVIYDRASEAEIEALIKKRKMHHIISKKQKTQSAQLRKTLKVKQWISVVTVMVAIVVAIIWTRLFAMSE